MTAQPVFRELSLPGVWLCTPRRFADPRGWFAETYSARSFAPVLGELRFCQDNIAHSPEAGVLRGLHFQAPPRAQDKLVQVLSGAILDVVVDLRRDRPSYGQHLRVTLSAKTGDQLFVPKGFAHGYVCLEPDCLVLYKVSDFYSPEHERAILWNDATLGIDWGTAAPQVSGKDAAAPPFAGLPEFFGEPA